MYLPRNEVGASTFFVENKLEDLSAKKCICKSYFFLKQVSFHRKKNILLWEKNYNRKFWF